LRAERKEPELSEIVKKKKENEIMSRMNKKGAVIYILIFACADLFVKTVLDQLGIFPCH